MAINYAYALSGQGKHWEAAKIFRDTHAVQEWVLGKEHLQTLMTAIDLANALSQTEGNAGGEAKSGDGGDGDDGLDVAAALLRTTLVSLRGVYSAHHPLHPAAAKATVRAVRLLDAVELKLLNKDSR